LKRVDRAVAPTRFSAFWVSAIEFIRWLAVERRVCRMPVARKSRPRMNCGLREETR
jgi:hypothetical protein